MSTTIRWQDTVHPAAAPRDSLPSEYAFASSPPVADTMRSWDHDVGGSLNRQLSDQERMAQTIRRKFSGDVPTHKLPARRNLQHHPPPQERPRSKATSNSTAKPDRKMSNEERYLKSSVDDRVARVLNERKSSNEERGTRFDSEHRSIARLELSRLFTRRKSSKMSGATSNPSSNGASDAFLTPPHSTAAPPAGSYFRLRKSRSRDSPPLLLHSRLSDKSSHKINVRKPPPGIQHWFEGVSEEYAVSSKGHSRQSSAEHMSKSHTVPGDSFFNNSTPRLVSSDKAGEPKPRVPLRGVGVPRSPPASTPRQTLRRSKTSPGLRRPESMLSSDMSVSETRPASHSKNMSLKRRCLPDAIEESVLVLSETESSDSESPEQDKAPFWMDDGFDGSIQRASRAEFFAAKSPVTVKTAVQRSDKPLPQIRMSGTVIDDETQLRVELDDPNDDDDDEDGYSSRTSLLSDLRPLSFQSRGSQDTIHGAEEWDVGLSPTSITFPERAMQRYFDSNPYTELPDSSARRWESDGPTHRLMAVTPEEAALLSAMRRKRAQMHADYLAHREIAATTPTSAPSRGLPTDVAANGGPTPAGILSPGEISPLQTTFRQERPGSRDTVSRLWQDVRDFRHANPSPGVTHRDSNGSAPAAQVDFDGDVQADGDDDGAYSDDESRHEKHDFADFDESYDHHHTHNAVREGQHHDDRDHAAALRGFWRESGTTTTTQSSKTASEDADRDVDGNTNDLAEHPAPKPAVPPRARPPMRRAKTEDTNLLRGGASLDGSWSGAGSNKSALEAAAAAIVSARAQRARRRSRWSDDGTAAAAVAAAMSGLPPFMDSAGTDVEEDGKNTAVDDDDDAELDVLAAWNELGGWRRSTRLDSAPI